MEMTALEIMTDDQGAYREGRKADKGPEQHQERDPHSPYEGKEEPNNKTTTNSSAGGK